MTMKKMGGNFPILPMPVTLVGSNVDEKANFQTTAWVSRVHMAPPLIAVEVNNGHHTYKGIEQNKTFSVNFPSADMVEITDYCGIVSGKKVDKSGLFEVFYGECKTAPMIESCPLTMECKVVEMNIATTPHLIIGEIIESYVREDCLDDGKLNPQKADPIILTSPDRNYWRLGEKIAKAFSVGKDFTPDK